MMKCSDYDFLKYCKKPLSFSNGNGTWKEMTKLDVSTTDEKIIDRRFRKTMLRICCANIGTYFPLME